MPETIKSEWITDTIIRYAHAAKIPVIMLDGSHNGCTNITYDYGRSLESVVEHVITEHKCTDLFFMAGTKGNSFSKERIEAFKRVLARHNIEFNEKTMLGDEAVRKITKLGEKIAELEKISFAPSIIEGAGQKWSENSDKDALFRSNAEFDEFVKVLVDGTEIDDSCYKAYAGSTVVELRADYLKTLSAGEHTLSIVSKNGRADTTFTVLEENAGDAPQTDNDSTGNGGNSTQTGDGFIMQFALLFISCGAVIGTAIAAKKRKEEE